MRSTLSVHEHSVYGIATRIVAMLVVEADERGCTETANALRRELARRDKTM